MKGRRPVAGTPREGRIELCVTEEEKKLFQKRAMQENITIGQLVRRDVLGIPVDR